MSTNKVEWMFFITYCELCFSLMFEIAQNQKLTIGGIFGYVFIFMLLYWIMWNVVSFVGHIIVSIYFRVKGLGYSPILLYPFIFGTDKKGICHLFWNVFCMGELFYPKKVFMKLTPDNESYIYEICRNAQYIKFFAEVFFCLILGGICALKGYIGIGVSGIFFAGTIWFLANLKTDAYHGCLIKAKNMKQGYVVLYLAQYLILYSNDNHILYDRFENVIKEGIPSDFEYISLEIIEHMYMSKCVNDNFKYPEKIKGMIEEECFPTCLPGLTNMDIVDKKFSVMKAYLCYCVLKNDISSKNVLRYYLQNLVNQEETSREMSFIRFNSTYQWYLDTMEEGKIQKQDSKYFKNTVLRRNQFYETFSNYYKTYIEITGFL